MRALYPPIDPFRTFYLPVSSVHTLYVEQVGNESGLPIVFLHGGPGGGLEPKHRQYFDPRKWHITLFDQRGAGRSIPKAHLIENTTWDLVEDLEKLRRHLGFDSWYLFGGSWGSTLALAYAESYPKRVAGLILRGIFLARQKDIDWLYQHGASEIHPDAWESFLSPIPHEERDNLVNAYHKRLMDRDENVVKNAASSWCTWEGSTCQFFTGAEIEPAFFDITENLAPFAKIECHYVKNQCFFETDGWLLKNINRIHHIPGIIIQGRFDIPCPTRGAFDLHQAWPKSDLRIVPNGGHSAKTPSMTNALITATDEMAKTK